MARLAWVIDLVTQLVKDRPTAELVVERLQEEGVLHLGYGNADIDQVVEVFSELFGTTKVSRQDRWAANRLVNKYGAQTVVGVIELLAEHCREQYAPVIGSIVQLENKWVNVISFLRNSSQGREIIQ